MKPVGYSSFIEDYQVDGEIDHRVKSFQRSLTEPDTGVTTVDISNSQDNSIIAGFNSNTKTIYGYSNVPKVYTTDAFEMFAGLEGLESLDLSGINFYYTESMNSMFSSCYQLTSLDLSGIDTLNVTDMSDMSSSVESAASYARQAEQILNDINFVVNAMTYYPITISSVQQDSSNVKFPYKYVVPISGLTSYDGVDAYGIDGQEGAIESGTNQIILHFSKEITQETSIVLYGIKCRLYTPDQGGN